MLRKPREVKPDWRVVQVEQISMCDKDWVAEKQITSCGVYVVVDANLHVHICSLTPNLEGWPVQGYAEFANQEAWERDEGEAEQEMINTEELVNYYGTDLLRCPNRPLEQFIAIPEQEEDEEDERYRGRVAEAAREYFAGNPTAFTAGAP